MIFFSKLPKLKKITCKKNGRRETQLRWALLKNLYLILKILKGDIVLNTLPLCRAGAHIEPAKTLKMTIIIINQQCRRGVQGGGGVAYMAARHGESRRTATLAAEFSRANHGAGILCAHSVPGCFSPIWCL